MEIASPCCSDVGCHSHCQSVVHDGLEVRGRREVYRTLRDGKLKKVDDDCLHKPRATEMSRMVKSGDWIAACHSAYEAARTQSSCMSSLHVVVVEMASVASLTEETLMACVLPKTVMNVENLYLSTCPHQTLCVAAAAAVVAVALCDLMDEQLVRQLSQQQPLQQCQYDGFDVG